jgi:hypothetical protein
MARTASTRAQPGRQDLHDFGERSDGGFLDADYPALRRVAYADRERDRLLVVQQQRGEHGARRQLVAAVGIPGGLDRVAQVAQPVDVPPQGALGDLEPVGEFGSRPVPVGLQQRQQAQGAGAGVRHVPNLTALQDKKWPEASLVSSLKGETDRWRPTMITREIQLTSHVTGIPGPEHFTVAEADIDGEVLVRTEELGLAATYLELMRADCHLPVPAWRPGQRVGVAAIGTVVRSADDALPAGQIAKRLGAARVIGSAGSATPGTAGTIRWRRAGTGIWRSAASSSWECPPPSSYESS